MGFFSQQCHGCGESIVSDYAETPKHADWMKNVVAITPEGKVHRGRYDGYGRIHSGGVPKLGDNESYADFQKRSESAPAPMAEYPPKATVWHEACHAAYADPQHPNKYLGPSPSAGDQGYFGRFNSHPPGSPKRKTGRGYPSSFGEGYPSSFH